MDVCTSAMSRMRLVVIETSESTNAVVAVSEI
jgi:hypothetical protein